MKKRLYGVIVLAMLSAVLIACDAKKQSTESTESTDHTESTVADFTFEGVIFTYDGKDYDISEQANAIMDAKLVGDYIIIDGHINPKNGYYGIFNTKTKSFEKDLFGNNLTYYNDDVNTILYAFWSEIYDYNGTIIATCDMSEAEFIYQIDYINENTQIEVTISDGESERKVVFDL